jgi:RNA polymerase sigma factor (sigma-70 family)
VETPAREPLPVEERSALFEALHRLPPMQRKVVVLRHWLGLSVAETAAELGISEGTVKSHSHRALERLRDVLSHHAG